MTDWDRYSEISALREAGNPARALAEFEILREGSTDAADISSIFLGESLCYRDLERFNEAAAAASEAIRLLPEGHPNRPYAEVSLACIHEHQGNHDLAAQELRALLHRHAGLLSTDQYIQLKVDVQLRLVANLLVLGHAIEPLSIASSLSLEELSPEKNAELSYRKAQAHGLLGRQDEAVRLFREAIGMSLESSLRARAHFRIGEILYDRGEFSRALDEFKNAVEFAASDDDLTVFTQWVEHTTSVARDRGKPNVQ